jgi:hypothetical protein
MERGEATCLSTSLERVKQPDILPGSWCGHRLRGTSGEVLMFRSTRVWAGRLCLSPFRVLPACCPLSRFYYYPRLEITSQSAPPGWALLGWRRDQCISDTVGDCRAQHDFLHPRPHGLPLVLQASWCASVHLSVSVVIWAAGPPGWVLPCRGCWSCPQAELPHSQPLANPGQEGTAGCLSFFLSLCLLSGPHTGHGMELTP